MSRLTIEDPKPARCPQCGHDIANVTTRQITRRGRRNGKACIESHLMDFCSPTCGSHYQMGCEG